jgi:two-component system sensor histidine kinase UhpB
LHDNINQILAATRLYLKLAMDEEDNRVDYIDQNRKFLDKAIEDIRKLSKSLVAPTFSKTSLM